MGKSSRRAWLCASAVVILLAAACAAETPTTLARTATITAPAPTATSTAAVEIAVTNTPAPTPTNAPRTLTICTGDEPDTLYRYGGSMYISRSIQEAIYDGPIDSLSYGYDPVILEKLPSLADGGAVIRPVSIAPGALLVDSKDQLSTLHDGVTYRPAGCRSADCAQSYSGSDPVIVDQMTVTFTLKSGISWSDGRDLTAFDSVYSYELDARPDTPSLKYRIERTESYAADGPLSVVWIGKPGFIDPTYFLNFWHPLPRHAWSGFTASELLSADISVEKPLGWGPYAVEEWVIGSHIRLARNPNYFRAVEGLPHFDFLIFRFIGENATRAIAYLLSGTCDVANVTAHLDANLRDLVEMDLENSLQLHTTPGTAFELLNFGLLPAAYDDGYDPGLDRPDFFGDLRTRQAVAYCVDRERMDDEIFFGRSEVMPGYVPAGHPLFNAEAMQYPHDPQAGRALLEEVGWVDHDEVHSTPRITAGIPRVPDGTRFSVRYWTTTATQRGQAAQILKESLENCGIEIRFEAWEAAELFDESPAGRLFGRNFELASFALLTGSAPPCELWLSAAIPGEGEDHPDGWAGVNISGYSSPEFDAACRSAMDALPGEAGYADHHLLAQEIFAADLPVLPLYLRILVSAARPDFIGLSMDPTAGTEMWNIEEFNFTQK